MKGSHPFFKFLLLGAAILSMDAANAQYNAFDRILNEEVHRLQGLRSVTTGDLNAPESCRNRYIKMFGDKYVSISLGFGYGDVDDRSVALDALMFDAFVRKLVAPCPLGVSACGFLRDTKDPSLFQRYVFAPTGDDHYLVSLRITRASLSSNDLNNTTVNKDKQMQACLAARDKFMGEVSRGTDIAFYVGHSRDGGGPDFCPAVRLPNDHVNYDYYQKHKEGIKDLTLAMSAAVKAGRPNHVIGSFSCSSQQHFEKRLRAANPKAGFFLTSRLVSFSQVAAEAYTSLDSVLHQRCADGFNDVFEFRQYGTNLVNMF
jgi:hypothetical protein